MRMILLFFIFSLFTFSLHAKSNNESPIAPWGIDSELAFKKLSREKKTGHVGKKVCSSMIRFFQVYISPIDGPRSSFYPTSSQYAMDAIQKYGVLKGIALGCDRLMRENKELWVYERIDKYGIERKLDPVR